MIHINGYKNFQAYMFLRQDVTNENDFRIEIMQSK